MINLFKKTAKPINTTHFEKKAKAHKMTIPQVDYEQLWACSVQKTENDFILKDVSLGNSTVTVATDSADSNLPQIMQDTFKMQMAGQDIIFTYFAKQGFIGFNNCAVLAQDWLINKAISAPCEDAIAVNYTLNLKNKDIDELDKDIISEIKILSEDKTKFNITEICQRFAENKRKYGQALCIPLIEGVDYSIPFNIDAIPPNSYKGMTVIEPIWTAPVLDADATTNPMSSRFYKPTWFRMPNGQMVHHSWFIFNIYGSLADILKPTYYFGGIPLPQLMYEQAYAAHKTAKEAPMLAQSKRLNYVEGNPNAMLFDEGDKREELKLLSWLRNNWGWLLIKPEQKIGQLDTTLTDFDSVVMLGYQLVAAISGVIATRLLETSPKGWQSSGSYEDKQYIKLQKSIQNIDYCPILDKHFRLLAKSKYGMDLEFCTQFDEIDTPTAKEAAEIREINSRTDATYINAGVVSSDEVRDKLREDEESGFTSLADDIEPEDDPFEDLGGSETSQAPFQ